MLQVLRGSYLLSLTLPQLQAHRHKYSDGGTRLKEHFVAVFFFRFFFFEQPKLHFLFYLHIGAIKTLRGSTSLQRVQQVLRRCEHTSRVGLKENKLLGKRKEALNRTPAPSVVSAHQSGERAALRCGAVSSERFFESLTSEYLNSSRSPPKKSRASQ